MQQRVLLTMFVIVFVLSFFYFVHSMPREADTLYVNGTVYTLLENGLIAEAVAVRSTRIVGVGSSEELRTSFVARRIIDLEGKTVVPGLIDAHVHMSGLGQMLQSIMLSGITSPEKIVDLIRARASQVPTGEWIYGRGWDQNLWPSKQFPTKSILDAVTPKNPVILGRIDGHAIWVNSAAMQLAGITRETMDPPGGKIIRDMNGNPSGVFIDDAKSFIEDVFPPPTSIIMERNILLAADECVKAGLTEVHDMGDSTEIEIYKRLADEGRLPLRVYVGISGRSGTWNTWQQRKPLVGYANDMLDVRAMKLQMDGALGSRGAALIEDYSDDPDNRGWTIHGEEELERYIRAAITSGYQPCVHAIGDRGNEITLNVYQKVLNSIPKGDYRARIEHAQVLAPADIPRFKEIGVLPSMQPAHCVSDMFWAEDRLGSGRVKGTYAWRSLLLTGTIILAGSDFPNDVMYPLWGFYAAITRSDPTGYPADGWFGGQKMTRKEALQSYTLWAAYGSFHENIKGTIECGKYADLTILSSDIMKIPPLEILDTDVEMTIVGGKIVYEKVHAPPAQ